MFGGPGIFPSQRGQATNTFTLQPTQVAYVPAGSWWVKTGFYLTLQEFDPTTNTWRVAGSDGATGLRCVQSDGFNWRIANTTGSVVGGLITNAGTGYTSTPTVTVSSGGATFAAIVGGAVSTTVSVTNGGSNYTYPPLVVIQAPGFGNSTAGLAAAGTATLTAGAVSSVTISNQGAGYTFIPTVTFVNDPRDTTGTGASATAALTGAQTITALILTNIGTGAQTAVPTIAFTGGGGASAAATAIMDWTITNYSATGAGGGYVLPVKITGFNGQVAGTPANTNPLFDKQLVTVREANIAAALSSGGITPTAATIIDGGRYSALPTALISSSAAPTTVATLTLTMGGATDSYLLFPAA